jgi:hypothetical protein
MKRYLCVVVAVIGGVGCGGASAPPAQEPGGSGAASAAPPAPVAIDRSSEAAFRSSVRARMLAEKAVTSALPGADPLSLDVVAADGSRVTVNLDRVWDTCTRRADLCEQNVAGLIAALAQTARPAIGRGELVVTVRTRSYADNARAQVGAEILSEPLVGDLVVLYAFDEPDRFRYASAADLAELKLSTAEAALLARANVEAQVGNVEELMDDLTPGGGAVIKNGLGLEPSLLLQTERWAAVAARMSCTLYAAAPENDAFVILCGTSAQVADLRTAVTAITAQAEHPMSNQILVWSKDRWTVAP